MSPQVKSTIWGLRAYEKGVGHLEIIMAYEKSQIHFPYRLRKPLSLHHEVKFQVRPWEKLDT